MSDDPTLPENGSGEAASAAEGSPPPWGDDFNPERAWRTIEHLRGRERELESDAKAFKRLQEDEDARLEWLAQQGYEIEDPEEIPEYDEEVEEDLGDDDDPYDQRLAAIEQQVQAQAERDRQAQEDRAAQEFLGHVEELAGAANTELSQEDVLWIYHQSQANGFNPKATEKAFEAYQAHLEKIRQQAIEEYRTSKRAPHFSTSGQSATQAPNLDDPQARQQWMQERVANLERD